MQDLIFAGTRDRKPLGMAEVTLTMIDPEAYEGPVPVEPEVVVDHDGPPRIGTKMRFASSVWPRPKRLLPTSIHIGTSYRR